MAVFTGPQNQDLTGTYTETFPKPTPGINTNVGPAADYPPGTIAPQNVGLPTPGYYYTPTQYPGATLPGGGGGGDHTPSINWDQFIAGMFGYLNLPQDVINELVRIFRMGVPVDQAVVLALGYIRGTDWYKGTFPGIQQGINAGLFQDERGYRAYVNQIGVATQQYLGRAATSGEITSAITGGLSPDIVGRQLEGGAYIKAYGGEIQYLSGAFGEGRLSEGDLTSLGRQQAGLGSNVGAILQARVEKASARMRRIFEGTLATPSLSLAGGRLATAAAQAPADIGA